MQRLCSLIVAVATTSQLQSQQTPATVARGASAPVSDLHYEVTFNRQTAADRIARVVTTFAAAGGQPVILSLPAWTPGAYEISNFARRVLNFSATAAGRALSWDKVDFDTWRIRRDATTSGPITVTFDYRADTLDNAMSWARPDFLLFNGTNLFLYPEGQSFSTTSRVTIRTESDWKVTTGMARGSGPGTTTYRASNYHDLVDMPFFVGNFDVDSSQVAGKWMRFATYPVGSITGNVRQQAWDQLRRSVPPQVAVFGEVPWDTYSVLQILDSTFQGASGLEHSNSHVDVLSPVFIGSDFQPSLYAHEIFHAWNVKRLRPAELWPYRYDVAQPTPWLWVSEGITDYYADLALVRAGLTTDSGFYAQTTDKINQVDATVAVALEDASLNTWIDPVDGTRYIYYPKGSLAGLALDIMIRDASDNRRSLDHVMREMYESTYKRGRGFTREDWWGAVSRAARGKSFADFERRHIDGREPFAWSDLLPLAGLRAEVVRVPRLGVATTQDAKGVLIEQVDPSSAAAAAGVRVGDYLLAINDLSVEDQGFGPKFRAMFINAQEGQPMSLRVRRGEQTLTLSAALRLAPGGVTVTADPGANAKAQRIRNRILRGAVDQ